LPGGHSLSCISVLLFEGRPGRAWPRRAAAASSGWDDARSLPDSTRSPGGAISVQPRRRRSSRAALASSLGPERCPVETPMRAEEPSAEKFVPLRELTSGPCARPSCATATAAMCRSRRAVVRSANARSGPVDRAADQAASTRIWPGGGRAFVGRPAVPCGPVFRIGERSGAGQGSRPGRAPSEAPDVADHCDQRRRRGDMHAGDGHQPPDVAVSDDVLGDHAIGPRELLTEEVELPQAPVDGQPLIDRQLELGEPSPALDPEGGRSSAAGP
jgi:hypothetical protein